MRNPFITPPRHPQDNFLRWRIPFIAKGAIGETGGFWRVLGVSCRWNGESPKGWSIDSGIGFFGLISLIHHDSRGGTLKRCAPEWEIHFLKINLRAAIRPADIY